MVLELGLKSALGGISGLVPSKNKSCRIIDHMFTKGISVKNIVRRGKLPMGMGF